MSDEKYEIVIQEIPRWKPTRDCRTFGVSAIKSIVKCEFLEAIEIRKRLEVEGLLPKDQY